MSGETLEHYFRHLNLDERRRKYLENLKEGKQVDKDRARYRSVQMAVESDVDVDGGGMDVA